MGNYTGLGRDIYGNFNVYFGLFRGISGLGCCIW